MINLPRESKTATEIVAWWTSMPIYFSWLITALLLVGGDTNNHNLPQSGRLLYCVHYRQCTQRDPFHLCHRGIPVARQPIPPARHFGAAKICFISGKNMP